MRVQNVIKTLNKPFLTSIITSIFLAYLYPEFGAKGGPLKPEVTVKYGAIIAIFFISGLSLQTKELISAMYQYRIHLFIQFFSLLFIPLVVQLFVQLLGQFYPNPDLLIGFITVSCMPPPVSSAVLLTKKVGGNEAAAVFNSALGSFLGILISPALLYLFFSGSGDVPIWGAMFQLSMTIVIPVISGQCARKCIGHSLSPYRNHLSMIGNSMLLLIIYTTFCETFSKHDKSFTTSTVLITTLTVVMLQIILLSLAFYTASNFLNYFTPGDVIAIIYCSTHKSLTLGFPMLKVLFESQAHFILISFPLLVYHPMQILIGSLLVPLLQKWIASKSNNWKKLNLV